MLSWQASLSSQHHQLCHQDLQFLIQNHMAPPHGPPARVLSPLSFPQHLLHSSKLLRESSASLLHLAFLLPKLHGKGRPSAKAMWFFLSWLLRMGLNPSASLPLQPHLQLLLQSVTPASIPMFFQLYWAAIVSLGRCSPMAWSQSSPSSHTGAITRGSCLPGTSWVEVTPISLAQSVAIAT